MEKKTARNIPLKTRKKLRAWLRRGIQLFCFLFFSWTFTAAFSGVKYIFTQIGAGEPLAWNSFLCTLLILCLFTIISGRFFCGFFCAFGTLGDALHAAFLWIFRKLGKKPPGLPEGLCRWMEGIKYGILLVIVLMCFAGVYSEAHGTSPWDVFSMLHAGNFHLGNYIPGLVILLLLAVGMCVQERFFCRFFCPMGAVFSLLPVLPLFSLQRDREHCAKGCHACGTKCPSNIELPSDGSFETPGECFQCQKCIDTCPKGNIHCRIKALRGNEEWFTLLKAFLLLALLLVVSL